MHRDQAAEALPAVALITAATSDFGLPALHALARLREAGRIQLVAVVDSARPLARTARARALRLGLSLLRDRALPRTVSSVCARLRVPVYSTVRDLNGGDVAHFLRASNVDFAVVFGCDQILRAPLLTSGPRFVNYHNSYLPQYRGVGATAWPLLEGKDEAGFTFHTIEDEAIDEGRLVLQRKFPLREGMSSRELGAFLNREAALALPEVLDRLQEEASLPPLPKGGVYYTRKSFASLRDIKLDDAPSDIAHRAHVLGQVEMRVGKGLRLRLQGVTVDDGRVGVGPKPLSIRIPLKEGAIRVGRINYLPARLFSPLVWAARYRNKR